MQSNAAYIGHNQPPEQIEEAPAKPKRKRRTWKATCPECMTEHEAKHPKAIFCSEKHSQAYADRMAIRGKKAMPYLLAWRGDRGAKGSTGAKAWSDLQTMLDRWNAEDKEKGRMKAADYVQIRQDLGFWLF